MAVSSFTKFTAKLRHLQNHLHNANLILCLFTTKSVGLNRVTEIGNAKVEFTNGETDLPAEQYAFVAIFDETFLGCAKVQTIAKRFKVRRDCHSVGILKTENIQPQRAAVGDIIVKRAAARRFVLLDPVFGQREDGDAAAIADFFGFNDCSLDRLRCKDFFLLVAGVLGGI